MQSASMHACLHAQAARGEPLQFSLLVPGRGSVAGVLRYYPFEAERETLPAPEAGSGRAAEPLTTYSLTQPLPSQAPPAGTTQASDGARCLRPLAFADFSCCSICGNPS
jgi:hypothetical protein